jgi:glycosyltransferase involved in cell wall biosynthesis
LTVGRDVNFTAARVDDINSLLSSACAGVVCSTGSEIICRVAQEFLVCGTPIVISGVGSLREIPLPCDGFDYGGLRFPEIEDELWNFLEKSRAESREVREARAGASAKRFGLEAMASSLSSVIAELGIYPI